MKIPKRIRNAGLGAMFFTLGGVMYGIALIRGKDLGMSDSELLAYTVFPLFVLALASLMISPVWGWWSPLIILAIAAAIGAALGAIMFDLTEPAPLGSPANPRPVGPRSSQEIARDSDVVLRLTKSTVASPDMVIHVAKNRTNNGGPSPLTPETEKKLRGYAQMIQRQAKPRDASSTTPPQRSNTTSGPDWSEVAMYDFKTATAASIFSSPPMDEDSHTRHCHTPSAPADTDAHSHHSYSGHSHDCDTSSHSYGDASCSGGDASCGGGGGGD